MALDLSMFKDWNEIVDKCAPDDVATISCIPALFSNIIAALLMLVGITALGIFILGGFKLINSGGDPKQLESGRNTLIFGVIGLIMVLLSFFVINVVVEITGVEIGCDPNTLSLWRFGCK